MVREWEENLGNFKGALLFGSQLPGGIVEMEVYCFQPHLISNFPRGKFLVFHSLMI